MFITPADLERAERLLDESQPVHTVTERGVELDFCQASDPDLPALHVAYRTYRPPQMASLVSGPALLFIPDAWQSGQVYDQAAYEMAERGFFAAALSLGLHGSGRWYSDDACPIEQQTLERYCQQVSLVALGQPAVASNRLVLVGGGVLGSVIAQHYAGDHEVAGIVLLGGCLPSLAAPTQKVETPSQRWWQRRSPVSSLTPVSPPDQAGIRNRWLGYSSISDQEVFAVRQYLCSESPLVFQEYEALAGKPTPMPQIPALVLVGEQDAVISQEIAALTATAYKRQPIIIPGAPHLLARSAQRHLVFDHLAAFCQATVSPK